MNLLLLSFHLVYLVLLPTIHSEFACLSETNGLFYYNSTKKIEDLPTIRLFQGVYGSQWAMQWVAYIYLTEMLGVNVTWYPSDIHESLVDPVKYNVSVGKGYPHYFFDWIADDKVDLLFEIWPVAMDVADSISYFESDTVLDGGTSGVYGEIGWFIPQYLVNSQPTAIVPTVIKKNETLRKELIDAMTIDSGINWIDKWFDIRIDDINDDIYPYDSPNGSNPTVFGSDDYYGMSNYSFNQSRNVLDGTGIDFNFVTFGNEDFLSDFLIDLYSKQLPFVANLYTYV